MRSRWVRAWCALVGSSAAVLLIAPIAQAGWLPPLDISPSSEHIGSPHVVLDASGNATAVWEDWNGLNTVVEDAYRPAGASWQAPNELSEEGLETIVSGEHDAYSPSVAVDADGDTTIVWARWAGTNRILIQAVYRPVGGSWQAPVQLDEMHSTVDPEPHVAVDPRGDAVAVWKSDEVVESAYRQHGEGWEAPVQLSPADSYVPQVDVDGAGDAGIVWMHYDGSTYVVEGTYRSASTAWETPHVLTQAGEEGGDPQLAIDANGDALVAWDGHPAAGEEVRAVSRPAGGNWEAPVGVSQQGDQAQAVRVALDPSGNALLAWAHSTREEGGYTIVQSSYRPAGGSWQAPEDLSAGGENAYPSDVVFDTHGNAAIVWQRSNGSHEVAQADYRPAGEGWQSPTSLSEEAHDAMDPVVVLDAPGEVTTADGDATAVWIEEVKGGCKPLEECVGAGSDSVQASGYDAIEAPSGIEAPATGEAGVPVAISASSLDAWSPVISFGDGGEAAATSAVHTYSTPGEYTVSFTDDEVLGYERSLQRRIVIDAGHGGGSRSGSNETPPGQEGPTGHETPVTASGGSSGQVAPSPPAGLGLQVAALPRQSLREILRSHELRFSCQLGEAGLCVVRTSLGSAALKNLHAGRLTLIVRLSARQLRAIRHMHMLRLPFTATGTGRETATASGLLIAR
jgi:hypothetical protein